MIGHKLWISMSHHTLYAVGQMDAVSCLFSHEYMPISHYAVYRQSSTTHRKWCRQLYLNKQSPETSSPWRAHFVISRSLHLLAMTAVHLVLTSRHINKYIFFSSIAFLVHTHTQWFIKCRKDTLHVWTDGAKCSAARWQVVRGLGAKVQPGSRSQLTLFNLSCCRQ